MESNALVLERKIIGVLMRAAREKAHRTVKQAAQRLGVRPSCLAQYEMGAREISLPELEVLAAFLRVPLSFFLGDESVIEQEPVTAPAPEEMRTRRAMLGAKLKQARLVAGKSTKECADAIGRTPAMLLKYERGQADVPITELDRLATYLGVNIPYFAGDKAGRKKGNETLDLEAWSRLPPDIQAFILDANGLPYLRMALKFRDLPATRLHELGEILLVVR